MSAPYIGEIRMAGFNYAPQGWLFCDGSLIGIDQNSALFNLIGTTYGGDGQTTFALPNLQGCVPVHQGSSQSGSYTMGQYSGVEQVTLSLPQFPQHTHTVPCAAAGGVASPANAVFGGDPTVAVYAAADNSTQLNSAVLSSVGGNQPHSNMMPYCVINFIIAAEGIYPSQN